MTMPNYVVNWDELNGILKDYIVPLSYSSLANIIGVAKGKGFRTYVDKPSKSIRIGGWRCDSIVALSAIEIYSENPRGTIRVVSNGVEIFSDIELLGKTIKTHWETLHPLNTGEMIEIFIDSPKMDLFGAYAVNIEYIDVLDNLENLLPTKPPEYEDDDKNSYITLRVIDSMTGNAVSGALFELYDMEGKLYTRFKNIGANNFYALVPKNEYIIKQYAFPIGYSSMSDLKINANINKYHQTLMLDPIE